MIFFVERKENTYLNIESNPQHSTQVNLHPLRKLVIDNFKLINKTKLRNSIEYECYFKPDNVNAPIGKNNAFEHHKLIPKNCTHNELDVILQPINKPRLRRRSNQSLPRP